MYCRKLLWSAYKQTEFRVHYYKILTSSAVICVDKTVSALIASRADTLVRAIGVLAGSTIAAWGRNETLVYIFMAQAACIADTARTREV